MPRRTFALVGGVDHLVDAIGDAGPADAAAVLCLADHPSADVRLAVAQSLPHLTEDEPGTDLVATAIALSTDAVPRVRDWACFALGQQWREVDAPSLREALVARLDDPDVETRDEALVGLAYRQDVRALPYVRAGLVGDDVCRLVMVAAGALGDPELHELVLRHRTGWARPEDDRTADAACRLTDPLGPGEDVLQGAADMLRRAARDLERSAQTPFWLLFLELTTIAPHRSDELYGAVLERLVGDELASRHLRLVVGDE